MPLTILHILEATEGGARRHLMDLVRGLDPADFTNHLAVSLDRDPRTRAMLELLRERHPVVLHEIPMSRAIRPFADLRAFLRLVACIRTVKPDLLHAHSAKGGFLGRMAGGVCRIPVVYTPHAFPFLMQTHWLRKRGYRLLETLVRPLTSALIAVSREEVLAARQLGYPERKIHFIPNGMDPVPEQDLASSRRRPGVAYLGRLTCQKGVDLLIAAAPSIAADIHVYGAGEMAHTLHRQVARRGLSSRVHFNEAVAPEEVIAQMRTADVLVVPSRWEGCPYIILEAFAAGVPVVATSVGGNADLIQHDVNGRLIPPEDPSALAEAVNALLHDPASRHRLAAAARVTLARHPLSKVVADTTAVYISQLQR